MRRARVPAAAGCTSPAATRPIVNNVLASFDTRALGNGDWTLRLIVVDSTGNYPVPCQVTISVQN